MQYLTGKVYYESYEPKGCRQQYRSADFSSTIQLHAYPASVLRPDPYTGRKIIEYKKHGAGQAISDLLDAGFLVVHQDFTPDEIDAALAIAVEIASHRITRDRTPSHHLAESFAIMLMLRSNFRAVELLIDELAARDVATQRKVSLIGFPGILIRACRQRIIGPDDVLNALTECQRQGTHYSPKLINEIYSNLKRSQHEKEI